MINTMSTEHTHVMSITSGKGGVGKTTLTANLALEFAKLGEKVLVLDGDLGMANLDIMFSVRTHKTLHNVITGESDLSEVLVKINSNVTLIPGASGIYELQSLNSYQRQHLLDQVNSLSEKYTMMLIDTAPGIDANVLYLNGAAQETTVVVTPDPASITDSYALIKVLNERCKETQFSIICNQVKNENDGVDLFRRLENVTLRFLQVRLNYSGSIPLDLNLRQSTRVQQLVTNSFPDSTSAQAIRKIANQIRHKVRHEVLPLECKGGLQFFWQQVLGVA